MYTNIHACTPKRIHFNCINIEVRLVQNLLTRPIWSHFQVQSLFNNFLSCTPIQPFYFIVKYRYLSNFIQTCRILRLVSPIIFPSISYVKKPKAPNWENSVYCIMEGVIHVVIARSTLKTPSMLSASLVTIKRKNTHSTKTKILPSVTV